MLYLAAPVSRSGYVTASLIVLLMASALLVGLNGLSLMFANMLFDLQIDFGLLWTLQLNAGLLLIVLGAIAYVLASLFDDSSRSYMVTGGIFALFLMANIFSGFSDRLDWLNTLSIFSLFDANAQIQGESAFSFLHLIAGICHRRDTCLLQTFRSKRFDDLVFRYRKTGMIQSARTDWKGE